MTTTLPLGVPHNPFASAKVTPEIQALAKFLNERSLSFLNQKEAVKPAQVKKPTASLNSDTLFGTEAAQALTAAPIPQRYAREVPDHLKIFHVPEDFNQFFTELHPNLLIYAQSFLWTNQINVNDVINSFTIYLLEESKEGDVRYTRYNPVEYPDQPYWKWIARQLRFFCMSFGSNTTKYNARHVSLSNQDEVENGERGMMTLDEVSAELDQARDTSIDYTFATQVLERVKAFSDKHPKLANGRPSFEPNAYILMELRLQGYSNQEIGDIFNISAQGVCLWCNRLRHLLGEMLGMPVENNGLAAY